jgi:hypothetical protein
MTPSSTGLEGSSLFATYANPEQNPGHSNLFLAKWTQPAGWFKAADNKYCVSGEMGLCSDEATVSFEP